ncbi:hypothetical protein CANTEDRAFT_115178 [Yamadazyma tenuis ATCC 10573]|uniref:Uncharacterized protein n=1 Tax=Candida tenuis (strain ATCC 10573 / BCRC 21748 / CBS 615 / JCM 9827 / NBRC 10315 / NRRL Y-1498 / VKM Y-70) TaxID=590646 RepID=G3B897_CANTC|nr:uncharacterized protein CANTEDRAFT_115178 [Yamadazyma tenuis ATCC 10573]EGV61720.1 hypothetical protein CANTEDRAFT_115178 [Yamadazyma tenuis ATCC 10573]
MSISSFNKNEKESVQSGSPFSIHAYTIFDLFWLASTSTKDLKRMLRMLGIDMVFSRHERKALHCYMRQAQVGHGS